MKIIIRCCSIIFLIVVVMGHSKTQISLEKTLKKYEWEKRILLFIAEKKDIELIRNVNSFFNNKTCENNDRNLVLYKIIGSEINNYKIPQKYQGKTGIWLIGYDGNDKSFSKDSSLINNLYNIIDDMPMRKDEIMNNESDCN
ncbi:DUF4174 domain-containing protein [Alphaproteobacteria bacterium]|nr:DUF4174 domain-containing protein [Alphaproteobacteria bacterium]